ncbi:MAG: hypothetical protein IJZ93_05680 [Clostridia bacterium]|nr:hypothetical protein [Clostridia bacterium]
MIFEKIKRFRESPERTRITLTVENKISVDKQKNGVYQAKMNDGKYEFSPLDDLGASAGAGGLGTEVNADGNTFVNGLRVATDCTIHQRAPETSVNSFLAKNKIYSLDEVETSDELGVYDRFARENGEGESAENETEKTVDGAGVASFCDAENCSCGDEDSNSDPFSDKCSCKSIEEISFNAPKKCVFKKKHSISFLLCDVAFAGCALIGCKLIKAIFK